jgi:hypothetical protein
MPSPVAEWDGLGSEMALAWKSIVCRLPPPLLRLRRYDPLLSICFLSLYMELWMDAGQ